MPLWESGPIYPSTFKDHFIKMSWYSSGDIAEALVMMVLAIIVASILCAIVYLLHFCYKKLRTQEVKYESPNDYQTKFTDTNVPYRVAMSNRLLIDIENGKQDPEDLPCLYCKNIEMGEMACYTKLCPACGRPPPVSGTSPSPRILPKCNFKLKQCMERNGTDNDDNYFKFPDAKAKNLSTSASVVSSTDGSVRTTTTTSTQLLEVPNC